jgi:CBS domain-containing protein
MRTVSELLDGVYHLVDIAADETVLKASWRMSSAGIGALLVMRHGEPVGMLSERDLLVRVIGARRDPAETLVAEVMTQPVIHVAPQTSLDECRELMAEHRIRHLPVFCGDTPVAMVSLRDLLDASLSLERRDIDRAIERTARLH